MTTSAKAMVLWIVVANLLLCGSVLAGPTWLCAITSAVAVDEDGTVGPPDLDGLERPTFFRVDSAKKELTLLAPASRSGEVTPIESLQEISGGWLLSGVEEERPWSLIITEKGQVTLSIANDGVVWAIFGHALLETSADVAE